MLAARNVMYYGQSALFDTVLKTPGQMEETKVNSFYLHPLYER
jgi:hypothetical protein